MTTDAYLRFPTVSGDRIAFVAEDDIWLTTRDGGRAYRVSADHAPARSPRLSPDGSLVAWAAERDGAFEVYVAQADGGGSRRLTYWGQAKTLVRGWLSDTELLVVTTAGQAERQRAFAHAVPVDGSPGRRLPYGWIDDLALGPRGGVLLSTATTVEPAWWKRYRGGTAAQLWIDQTGAGEFTRVFGELAASLVSPLWTVSGRKSQRIGFVSDHEGIGQVYSAELGRKLPRARELVRHSDGDFYARHASSDGRSVVYVAGGSLYLLDSLDSKERAREVEVRLGGARTSRQPTRVKAAGNLAAIATDRSGRASVVETRGTIQLLTHREGPVRALAAGSGVRRRLPVTLGDTNRVAWVTDANGDDAIEVVSLDDVDAQPAVLLAAGQVGRVLEMAASPDGTTIAVASHDGRLRTIAVPADPPRRPVRPRVVDETENGDMQGLAFSPDSRWLAWSAPGVEPLRHIKMVELDGRARPFDVTPLRFTDTEPVFTADGRHLALLSVRSLDPVYDAIVFDLSFPNGCRPCLVPLAADTPSPFDPRLGGRPFEQPGGDDTAVTKGAGGSGPEEKAPPETRVDMDGLDQRLVPIPVPGGHYEQLRAVEGGLVWLKKPLQGMLGDDRARLEDEPPRATLEHIDLETAKITELADSADRVEASGDGTRLVVVDKDDLKVLPATRKVEKDDPDDVKVDLARVRVEVTPLEEWRQMYDEAWRLMRDHYWRADMRGVDWEAVGERYRPMLDRLGAHDDLIDLIWEVQAELGTSHAYVMPKPAGPDDMRRQGLLGADLSYSEGAWRIARIVPGESSEPRARSPLTAPGVAAQVGEAVVAVDGQPTGPAVSPGALLVGTAGKPVELTLASGGKRASRRRVVVVPLADEMPLRYQDWVNGRREHVHAATGGAVGYVHVPDMVSGGWAQLHRDLRTEVGRDALIVDVRGNRGGHTSQLVLEKLARRIIGWDVARGYRPESYPGDARRGPMVTVTDMYAGSDGDIITAAIRSMELGPVVGTRTWGGVIGIDGRYSLVDGTVVTQPRFSFWFEKFGWGVENHGVDPDIEVAAAPHDRAADHDVQLDHALSLVRQLLSANPAKQPPALPAV